MSAMIENISAITLATHDMARAVRFYRMLGFEVIYGGGDAAFTSFRAGTSYLNLIAQPAERTWSWWGRVIFYHSDVDALHARVDVGMVEDDASPPRPRSLGRLRDQIEVARSSPKARKRGVVTAVDHVKSQHAIEADRARHVVGGERDGADAFDHRSSNQRRAIT